MKSKDYWLLFVVGLGLLGLILIWQMKGQVVLYFIGVWAGLQIPLFFQKFRNYHSLFGFRIGIPIVCSIWSLVLYFYSIENSFLNAYSRSMFSDWTLISAFLSVISTLYAIMFAFSLWKAMTDFDDLKNSLRDEASMIQTIADLLKYFDNVTAGETQAHLKHIRTLLKEYVESMISDPRSDNGIKTALDTDDRANRNSKIISECVEHVEFLETEKSNDEIALEKVIESLSQLTLIRSHRVSCLNNHMSPFLFVVIGVMSLAINMVFLPRDPTAFNSNFVLLPVMAFITSYLFVMLWDLDQPFDGYWMITNEAFENVVFDGIEGKENIS